MSDPVGRSSPFATSASRSVGRTSLRNGLIGMSIAVCFSSALVGVAPAEEPAGCAAFKWPLKHEADLLQASSKPALASGSSASVDGKAYDIKLTPLLEAHLPQPPGRKPKMDPSSAGFLRYGAPAAAGAVQITSSAAVWIDVLQNGQSVRPTAFSGARDCPGVRKSLRFSLAAAPFVVEISGTAEPSIGIIAAPFTP